MPVPWSRCGNYKPHDEHYDTRDMKCPGWAKEDQLVRDLITSVNQYLNENYGPGLSGGILPEGLRLEMHPLVRRHLMVSRDLWEPGSGLSGDILEWFRVPVKITTDLPAGTWRLVIVTEDVLLSGRPASLAA